MWFQIQQLSPWVSRWIIHLIGSCIKHILADGERCIVSYSILTSCLMNRYIKAISHLQLCWSTANERNTHAFIKIVFGWRTLSFNCFWRHRDNLLAFEIQAINHRKVDSIIVCITVPNDLWRKCHKEIDIPHCICINRTLLHTRFKLYDIWLWYCTV